MINIEVIISNIIKFTKMTSSVSYMTTYVVFNDFIIILSEYLNIRISFFRTVTYRQEFVINIKI